MVDMANSNWTAEFFETRPVFATREFRAAATRAKRTASNSSLLDLLQFHRRAGRIRLIRRGIWQVIPPGAPRNAPADAFLVASVLAPDSVIGLHAASEFHGAAYSAFSTVTYYTEQAATPCEDGTTRYVPVKVPAKLVRQGKQLLGVTEIDRSGMIVRVTDRERTLVDMFDRLDLAGGIEEVWRSAEQFRWLDDRALLEYLDARGSTTLVARVGYFLDVSRDHVDVHDELIDQLLARATQGGGPFPLVPGQKRGVFVGKWHLLVPREVVDRSWEEPAEW